MILKQDHDPHTEQVGGNSPKTGSRKMQFIAGISASLAIAATGANSAWSSPALPYLKSNDSSFPLSDEQGAWIVSIYNLSDLIGSLFIIFLIDRIGRKFSLLFSGLPSFFSWLFIIYSSNYVHLLISKFVAGFGQGCAYSTIVIYLSEIADKNVRGILISIMRISSVTSTFLLTAVGSFCSYETLNVSCASVPLVFLIVFTFMPESPYYYLLKNKEQDALNCLMKLRGSSDHQSLIPIIREMKLDIENEKILKKDALKQLFLKKYNQKGLLIVACMKVTQLMTGQSAIINYTQEIFTISGSSFEPKISVLILASVRVIASCIVCGMMERVSKRMNFFISGILASVFLAIVGLFFFLKLCAAVDVTAITWLPLVALILFEFVYFMGMNVVPYAIQGEIFPINVRSVAVSSGMMFGSICSFVTTLGYYEITNAFGVYTAFWFFALVAVCGSTVSFLMIPATNGKTLEEIQAMGNPEMKMKLDLERCNKS